MSRIDELIHELAPTGVPHVPLGELGEFIRGRRFTKDDYVESGLGAIHYGEIYTHYGTAATETKSFVRPELKSTLRLAQTGDLIIAATGENTKDVCKAVAWLGAEAIAVHDDCYIYRHELEPCFASYYFQSAAFQDQKIRLTSESKLARVSGASLAKIIAPVPPREVQREVVKILDRLSELEVRFESELQEELAARRRQYAHYRDSLLTFREREREREREVRWATLGDVASFRRGTAITARDVVPGAIPVVANGPVPVYSHDTANRTGETIVVARSGAHAGAVSYWDEPLFLTDAFSIHPDARVVRPKYVFYWLRTQQDRLHTMKKGAGVPHVRVKELEREAIPVPPLHEQVRIVAILDKFDARVNDLSVGLQAELVARRKQYEYYRDKLLSFKEAAA
ncbi:MAG: restriction endonuclease subunit S [Coriobacteriia bacterium]